jgi:hypothetical protein
MTKDFIAALKYARKLVEKARKERDTKGYRENLGYDQDNKLRNRINKMNLSYGEQAAIMTEFYKLCDNI